MTASKPYAVYDIEVFSHDALVVFQDLEGNQIGYWHNDFEGILEFVKGHVLVGYNNYWYDDHILSKMIAGSSVYKLKQLNDTIIRGDKSPHPIHRDIVSLDCFQQIDVSRPGLKKVEGNMGKRILESSVPFNIGRPLTEQELEEVVEYCSYDVAMTAEIFKMREKSYFDTKRDVVGMMEDSHPNAYRWNTTTISANVLLDKPLPKWSSLRVPEEYFDFVSEEVKDMWFQENAINGERKVKKVTVEDFGNNIEFGFGGLHSVHKAQREFRDVKLWDVTSMYPNIAINLDVLGPATEKYQELLTERTAIKHNDKARSDALKLILNSVYGNLGNQYSMLHNPKAQVSVCVYGQVALYELGRRLSNYAQIVQMNTDGVAFVPYDDQYKDVQASWEEHFGLSLEEESFKRWIQKDVNNYIAIADDGYIATKGGEVGRYNKPFYFRNNSTRIVDICIVDYILYNKDIVDNMIEHLDRPELFQYVLQAGRTFKGTFDEHGDQYNNVNRVFATKKDGVLLQKMRQDEGLVRFADAPDKMLVWNEDVDLLEDFASAVDLNFYYQLIKRKLKGWE